MLGLDDGIAGLGAGQGIAVALLLAVLLGLRHATDPDHLAAVSTLALSDEDVGPRRAARLGLAWGAGHALTLVLLGVPVLLLSAALPDTAQALAELVIGLLIVALAARLLLRRRRPRTALGSSHRTAFMLGLAHGVGGSGGATIVVLGAISSRGEEVLALLLFAAATAVSMAAASAAFGRVLVLERWQHRLAGATPFYAAGAAAFGCWYALGALGSVPYVF